MPNFTERLTDLQSKQNHLKKDIARAVNISVMGYYRYEKGEREPSMSTLIAFADYFGVSIDYLVGRTDNPEINK